MRTQIFPKAKVIAAPLTLRQRLFRGFLACALILAALGASMGPAFSRAAPDSFADLAEKLSPAVVNISTVQTLERRGGRRAPRLPDGVPFGEWWEEFRDRFEDREDDDTPLRTSALGSGFIIDPAGYVVTNNHVVEGADEVTVIMTDGTELEAEIIGLDARSDLALLKVDADMPLPSVKWGDSDAERVGDWVIAIGNPFGLGGTVTAGIISARNRTQQNNDFDFIQTDASINRGNSGGPLFNMAGDVIGVNTAIFSPTGANVGIGFSIPSNDAQAIVEELRENGSIRRGWLGVSIQTVTEEVAESLGLDDARGILVGEVVPDSPADEAGLEIGDIILKWDGKEVANNRELRREVARTRVGKQAKVEFLRAGELRTATVTVGLLEEPSDEEQPERNRRGDSPYGDRELVEGMDLVPLNDELRERFRIGEDVQGVIVVRVSRRSAAYRQGMRPGTVIMRVNQREVSTPADVLERIDAAREAGRRSVLLLVALPGSGNTVHLTVPIGDDDEDSDDDN